VFADQQRAQQIGVRGVPFFVFNNKYAVSGAQATKVFAEVLQKAGEEEQPVTVLATDNAACAVDGSNC
jgi:predicted DsbA family dithiol-disulfide isomerase